MIDTNCLIMMISSRQAYHQIWLDFLKGKFQMLISNEILEEYSEVIARNIREDVAEFVCNVLLNKDNVIRIEPSFHSRLIEADPDDNKFIDCAICGNAKLIVTNDKHFNELDRIEFPKVVHINIWDMLHELGHPYHSS